QPAPDGALDEVAAGFAMAGIVEPHAGAAVLGRPGVERQRLGALHVRLEAAEPEQPGCAPGAGAYRDTPGGRAADVDEDRLIGFGRIGHGRIGHRRIGHGRLAWNVGSALELAWAARFTWA